MLPARKEPPPRTKVLITGGDPMVGQLVAALLDNAGYDARFLNGSFFKGPTEQFDGTRLIVLGPRLKAERRAAILDKIGSVPAISGVPLLDLNPPPDGTQTGPLHHVRWPCSIEELKREIEALLVR